MNQPTDDIPQAVMEQAADWRVREDGRKLSASEQAEFEDWLAQSERHRRAYAEVADVWDGADALTSAAIPGSQKKSGQAPTRNRQPWPLALAATVLVAVLAGLWLDVPLRLQADAMTAVGERKTVALPDGSSMLLNTDSAVAYDYDGDGRDIRLLRGEALFTVTPDRQRPFTVATAEGRTTVLGTRFNVRRDGQGAIVTVLEGRVAVTWPPAGDSPRRLAANQQLRYSAAGGLGPVRTVDAARTTAWQRGRLHFLNRPLGEVVAELDRYHAGKILIADEALRERPVNGVFRIDEPLAALSTLEQSLGIETVYLTDYLVLLRPSP